MALARQCSQDDLEGSLDFGDGAAPARDLPLHFALQRVGKLIEQRKEKLFFAGEVKIDAALRDFGGPHDLVHSRLVETLLGEELFGGL
jgi:hypothetical protein